MRQVLDIKNLSITFKKGNFKVYPISFQINKGEIVTIVGESGSGKSTLAKAIIRINSENAVVKGDVSIDGKNIYEMSEKELREIRMKQFSIAFQNSRELLNPLLRVDTQLKEVLKKKFDKQGQQEQIEELLELFNLDKSILKKYPDELSGGMVQKVLLMIAIALKPQLVILDEPTSSLDINSRNQIKQLIKDINKKYQTSFLIITHDFSVARDLKSKIMVLYNGFMVESGSSERVLDMPYHPYTKGLIQSSMDVNPYRDIWGIRYVEDKKNNGCPFYQRCHQHFTECCESLPILKKHQEDSERMIACNRGGIVKILEGKHISKSFKEHQVLKDINVEVYSSEVVALVGVSGSGKTTLASIVSGFKTADEGEILFEGKKADFSVLHRMSEGMQLILQDPETAINQSMTILDAIMEPVYLNEKHRNIKEEAKRLLRDVGLPSDDEILKRKVRTLSGGQKQRVMVARALSLNPKLLIADEITSMLDTSSKANLLRMLKGIQNERGLSMLFITHDLACAQKIADRIFVMDGKGNMILKNSDRSDEFYD